MRAGKGDARRTIAMFRRFAVGQRRRFMGAVLLMAVEALTAIAIPALIGRVISFVERGNFTPLLGFRPTGDAVIPVFAGAIVAVTAVNSLVESMAEVSLAKSGRTLGYHARTELFSHLQRLSLAFHVRRSTGDVLTRITGDVQALEEFVVDSVKDILGSAMLLAGTLAYLFYESWHIAVLAVVIVPLLTLVSNFFARRIKASTKELRAREGDLATTAQEMLTTITVVQTYGRAAHEQDKFDRESRSAMGAVLRTARLEAAFGFAVSVLEAAVIAVVILVGARLVDANTIDSGLLVTFILLIQGMFKPTRRIIKQWNTVAKVYASVERIGELLDRAPAVQDEPDAVPAPPLTGRVEFRDVSFAYQPQVEQDDDAEPAGLTLQSLSFTLGAGEVVALVGHSGAGKSTIAQLIPRLYDPQAGAVLIDGHDIRTFTLESLRAQISMVLQETVLLRGTVAENIAYGREGASMEDVVSAAKSAQAHDFIMALPDGYDTVLGERAATLSGGQRQRLAIARAFIRDTPILVLDEPTTGLDAQASAQVAEALQTLLHGRSAVIVSHDLNLIRAVDRILVLSGGRILEEGTPADLLAGGGLYAELYASQFGAAIAEALPAPVGAQAGEEVTVGVGAGPSAWSPLGPVPAAGREAAFETVLLDAVPRAASNREFEQLTGWAAAVAAPALKGPDVDPLQTRALLTALPGLADVAEPSAVAPHLERMLHDDWALESCVVDKLIVDPRPEATLRYRVRVRDRSTGAAQERLVGGRLFGSRAEAEAFADGARELAFEAAGRPDLRCYQTLVEQPADLGLVLHAHPVDPALPGLLEATDPERMSTILEQVLPRALAGLALDGCRTEVVKYAVSQQSVIRYELLWRLQPSSRTLRQVVYGKLYGDERGSRVEMILTALREGLGEASARPVSFLVPRYLGYLSDLRLTLSEALPGTPQVAALVRAHVAAGPPVAQDGVSAEGALSMSARAAGALHVPLAPTSAGMELSGSGTRTLAGEVQRLEADVDAIARFAPTLAAALHGHLDAVAAEVSVPAMDPVFSHGDFTMSEILLDGPISSVFDLDAGCAAEPALDLGRFVGQLAVTAGRAAGTMSAEMPRRARELEQVFLREYLRTRPDFDAETVLNRVAAYRAVSLVDIAVQSWARMKSDRLQQALSLLGDSHRLVAPWKESVGR